ncbi:MAG: hypothetical protein RL113_524 [Pseudomonadota bacterium]|jgi:2-polyprenyl-6-methoxyphenol hydroxylase-like FAD-dependent oxidoreductase
MKGTSMKNGSKIAIVGGGVSGVTAALYLSKYGIDVTLFEKKSSLVDGPPWCHLHAGGNLYREISDEQCAHLLEQSIEFIKFYPFVVDYRPTVIALPVTDPGTPQALLPRLRYLKNLYNLLIQEDDSNSVLGLPSDYFNLYTREEMERLREQESVAFPQTQDQWMIPVAKHLNLDTVQYPLIMVQEYGLNMFRLSSAAHTLIENSDYIDLRLKSTIETIARIDEQWDITFLNESNEIKTERFDYLINASGFETGKIDDMIGVKTKRMVEFKASYISSWTDEAKSVFPEVIFHGIRSTPQGMGQLTPYPGGYFQLHGMSEEITLYKNGLVSSSDNSSQPELDKSFLEKITKGWDQKEIEVRTHKAIEHISKFIPSFKSATIGSKPLFGAQQIPGKDASLRVAEVSFPQKGYARCEIIKVSSSIQMAKTILNHLKVNKFVGTLTIHDFLDQKVASLDEEKLDADAKDIAKSRKYPASLAKRNVVNLTKYDSVNSCQEDKRYSNRVEILS